MIITYASELVGNAEESWKYFKQRFSQFMAVKDTELMNNTGKVTLLTLSQMLIQDLFGRKERLFPGPLCRSKMNRVFRGNNNKEILILNLHMRRKTLTHIQSPSVSQQGTAASIFKNQLNTYAPILSGKYMS